MEFPAGDVSCLPNGGGGTACRDGRGVRKSTMKAPSTAVAVPLPRWGGKNDRSGVRMRLTPQLHTACGASGLHTTPRGGMDYIHPRWGDLETMDHIPPRAAGWITYAPAAQLHTDRGAIGLHPPPLGVIWKRRITYQAASGLDLETTDTCAKDREGGLSLLATVPTSFTRFLRLPVFPRCSRRLSSDCGSRAQCALSVR